MRTFFAMAFGCVLIMADCTIGPMPAAEAFTFEYDEALPRHDIALIIPGGGKNHPTLAIIRSDRSIRMSE